MKQRIFSGIQPSGSLHIGNYLGAIKQWIPLQNEYEAFFSIVDLHAITVPQDPVELRVKTLEVAKTYLAAGVDPSKATLFVQSHVPEHAELCWLLNSVSRISDLNRMTQYKSKTGINLKSDILTLISTTIDDINNSINTNDKLVGEKNKLYTKLNYLTELSEKLDLGSFNEIKEHFSLLVDINKQEIKWREDWMENVHKKLVNALEEYKNYENLYNSSGVGLFDYPVLMAADILLYDTAVVPVGEDQVQHVELTRTLARRFNDRFGETFVVPESRVMKEGARIMGLDDPTKKMSKSAGSAYNFIALTDDADTIRKKIRKAVTDSGTEIAYEDGKPALKNLINIYSLFSGKAPESIVSEYAGQGYGAFKDGLAETVVAAMTPIQDRKAGISDEEVQSILRDGAEKAGAIAEGKMRVTKERVGFFIS